MDVQAPSLIYKPLRRFYRERDGRTIATFDSNHTS